MKSGLELGAAALLASTLFAPGQASAADRFAAMVDDLRPKAEAAGISPATFEAAFAGLTVDARVIALAAAQPEFTQTIGAYVANRANDRTVAAGRALAQRWAGELDGIERRFGVDRFVILALWAMESNYGQATGGSDVIRSLATLACCTSTRPDYFRDELMAALRILDRHEVAPRAMTGSWAGAMGQTQFMPSSYLANAVDGDGDGRRDIWTSVPDVLASIASYLAMHGWERAARWGYEVRLPAGFDFTAITAHEGALVRGWQDLGIARPGGGSFPDDGAKAWLLLPAGAHGPAFLTLQNYWVIKTYNVSDAYTLAVGRLTDRLRGEGALSTPWPPGERPLPRAVVLAMQQKLVARGFPIDIVDGKIGPSSRSALRAFQASQGLSADGYPTAAVLARLGLSQP